MDWPTTDIVIFAVAAYLAVVTLVRLMRNRRDELVSQVRTRIAAEQRRKKLGKGTQQSDEAA